MSGFDEAPAQSASDSTNQLNLAGYIITFQNLDMDDWHTFRICLIDCGHELGDTLSLWRHNIQPIIYHIKRFYLSAREKLRDRESRFGSDWDESDPDEEILHLHRDTVTFNTVLQQLLNIYRFGVAQATHFWQVDIRSYPDTRGVALRAGDRFFVDREAWKCLLWFWWGFRVYFRTLVVEFLPILEDWYTWNWPNSQASKEGLRLVAFLVERRLRGLPMGGYLSARGWRDLLALEDRDAFNWLEDTD